PQFTVVAFVRNTHGFHEGAAAFPPICPSASGLAGATDPAAVVPQTDRWRPRAGRCARPSCAVAHGDACLHRSARGSAFRAAAVACRTPRDPLPGNADSWNTP